MRSGLLRGLLGGALPLVLLVSCSDASAPGEATRSDAVAAYVALDADMVVANQHVEPLTRAQDEEPSSPAGFVRGLRASFIVRDESGVFAARLVFQADASEADRALLAAHAIGLGLGEPMWLGRSDLWPDCATEPDCETVGQSGALP